MLHNKSEQISSLQKENKSKNGKKVPFSISVIAVVIGLFVVYGQQETRRVLRNSEILAPAVYKTTDKLTFTLDLKKERDLTHIDSSIQKVFANEASTYKEGDLTISASILNSEGSQASLLDVVIEKESATIFKITATDPQETLVPGKYSLQVEIQKGQITEIKTQNFSWGVLAINTNKSIYTPNSTAKIHMAVLDETGSMVCDAQVTLKITDPLGKETTLSTENKLIKVNPGCQLKQFILEPDYETSYLVAGAGHYDIQLNAVTDNGNYTIQDGFEVRDYVSFDIERLTATRIYPPEDYPVTITIGANEDFSGTITEYLPASFDVKSTSSGLVVKEAADEPVKFGFVQSSASYLDPDSALISMNGTKKEIMWDVELKKGDKFKIQYVYKAPNISPEYYLLGPLELRDYTLKTVFKETRQWQIASDAIAYVAADSQASSAASQSATLTTTANNLLVFFCGVETSKTITGPGGSWAQIYNEAGAPTQGMWWKLAAGGSETPSCSWSGADGSYAALVEYSGVETASGNTLDTNNSATGSGDATAECPSVTPSAGNHLYVSGLIFDAGGLISIDSWSNSFTERAQAGMVGNPTGLIVGAVADLTGTGAQSTTATASASGVWRCQTAAFNEEITSIDGRVFTDDDEVTTLNSQSVCGVINAGTPACATTDGSGYFTVTFATEAAYGDQLTVYLDGGTNLGNTVTVGDATDILTSETFRVYEDHVVVRNEQGSGLPIVTMDAYDDDQNATDMLYDAEDATPDTLSVEGTYELFVQYGYTFAPIGNIIQVHDIEIDGTWTSAAAETIAIDGTFKADTGSSFNSSTSVVTFDGTAGTEDIITDGTGGFYDLIINDGGNSLTMEVEDPLIVYGDLTITGGTLDTKSGESNQISVMTNWDNDDTFEAQAGTVLLNGSGAATYTIDAVGTGNYAFYDLTFNDAAGGATYQITTDLDVDDNLTLTGGTLDSNAFDIYVGGNWTNDDTFTEGTTTVYLDSGKDATLDTGCTDSAACTTQNFYNLVINKETGGDIVTLSPDELRVTNTFTITAGEFVQTTDDVQLEGSTALQLYDFGRYTNLSTGNITLGGNVINDYGSITLNANGAACGGADSITVTSTAAALRTWSGNGAFRLTDIDFDWMDSTPVINVASGTEGGNMAANFTFIECNIFNFEGLDITGMNIE